jgi:hypothetical protein
MDVGRSDHVLVVRSYAAFLEEIRTVINHETIFVCSIGLSSSQEESPSMKPHIILELFNSNNARWRENLLSFDLMTGPAVSLVLEHALTPY